MLASIKIDWYTIYNYSRKIVRIKQFTSSIYIDYIVL